MADDELYLDAGTSEERRAIIVRALLAGYILKTIRRGKFVAAVLIDPSDETHQVFVRRDDIEALKAEGLLDFHRTQ